LDAQVESSLLLGDKQVDFWSSWIQYRFIWLLTTTDFAYSVGLAGRENSVWLLIFHRRVKWLNSKGSAGEQIQW